MLFIAPDPYPILLCPPQFCRCVVSFRMYKYKVQELFLRCPKYFSPLEFPEIYIPSRGDLQFSSDEIQNSQVRNGINSL